LKTVSTEGPALDVIEISIFGPGKGESVVVHLGGNEWVIVDSCIDQTSRAIPALAYLKAIGVDVSTSVRMVVGTHAHDDHIAGIGDLFDECSSAFFVCSQALTSEEFYATIEEDAELARSLRASSYSEYRRVFDIVASRKRTMSGQKPLKRAVERLPLLELGVASGINAEVVALSPSHEAVSRALRVLASGAAQIGGARRRSAVDPNELAVALWIEVGGTSLLLGADLTIGPTGCGWKAVLSTFKPGRQATVFKVPHHGSPNAHHPEVWSLLLAESPVALLAPYRAGATPRPSPEDRARICALTPHAYISASPDMPARSRSLRKAAAELSSIAQNVREPWGRCGQVRARSRIGSSDWSVDLIPPGRRLTSGRA
jgi:beta-lactamase superfamily II metal-dependent hydrolase